MSVKKILYFIIIVFNFTQAARILCIFTAPFDSHQAALRIFTEELAARGHELIVLTPKPNGKHLPNITEIDVEDMSYSMWELGYKKTMQNHKSFTMDPVTFWSMIYRVMYPVLDAQLSTPGMQSIIRDKSQHFDLIIAEACIRPTLIVSARFKVPVVLASSFHGDANSFYTIGADMNPIFFPDYNIQKMWNLSFWDKLYNLYVSARLRLMNWEMEEIENTMIKKHFGENAPTMEELKKNVQLLLLNVHHLWDNNRPVPPSVLYLGSLHLKEPKSLPYDLKKYLDNSRNGVIYMSLGSKLKSSDLPDETLRVIINVFKALDYDILWKWDGDEIAEKPVNVRLETWLPQNDLLHHPNIKAFITQGGLQSTDEAIAAHIPLIGLPVFADQTYNTQMYLRHGIGLQLDITNLEEKEFRDYIIDVAENQRYRDNIKRLSRIMKEQRKGAMDKAMMWIELIATHGAEHLRSPLTDLSFTEYYMLDVIIPVVLITMIILLIMLYLLKRVIMKLAIFFHNETKLKVH